MYPSAPSVNFLSWMRKDIETSSTHVATVIRWPMLRASYESTTVYFEHYFRGDSTASCSNLAPIWQSRTSGMISESSATLESVSKAVGLRGPDVLLRHLCTHREE